MKDKQFGSADKHNKLVVESRATETKLISLERTQKLDLLIHLLSNLKQSLVICGVHGIGKTTLLQELIVRKQAEWPIVTIQASPDISFERIQSQILQYLKESYVEYREQTLSTALTNLNRESQKVIVLIEGAGDLVPGLVSTIIEYASSISCLRIVFSLTHDELHIKSSTDKEIDDCHFIEMPPLTEKQCGTFLQHLSAQPNSTVIFGAINDRMIGRLYRETHGVPGKIVSELPKLANYNKTQGSPWISLVVVTFILAAGISFFLYKDDGVNESEEPTSLVLNEAEIVEIVSPVIEVDSAQVFQSSKQEELGAIELFKTEKITLGEKPVEELKMDAKEEILSSQEIKPDADVKKLVVAAYDNAEEKQSQQEEKAHKILLVDKISQEKIVEKIEPLANKKAKADIIKSKHESLNKVSELLFSNEKWLLKQPKNHYTIQLMVLSKQQSIKKLLTKYPSLKADFKYYQVKKQGVVKYVLVHGTYKNSALASKAMKALPETLRKSWIRKFRTLQIELKN